MTQTKKVDTESYNLNDKWWHRLSMVFIWAITLSVFIFSLLSFTNNIPAPTYIYSFEKNYSKTFGFSKPCTFRPDINENNLSIQCGNLNILDPDIPSIYNFLAEEQGFSRPEKEARHSNLSDFLNRYSKSTGYKEEYLIKKYYAETNQNLCKSRPKTSSEKMLCDLTWFEVDYPKFNEKINQGYFKDISVKKVIPLSLLESFIQVFLFPIITFVILKFVVYKTIFYVIFGSKKHKETI